MPNFAWFWTQVAMFVLCQRLQMCFDVATDERLSAQVFRAYSATARLRLVAEILKMRVVSDKMIEVASA